jgi:hypothetical protein
MVPAPSYEHARVAQQLAEILGPPARAAGLTAAMHEFNLGDSEEDYRIPDGGLHRPGAHGTWLPTAALVVEIFSPNDETWEKLPFYAAHNADEVLILDPTKHTIDWLGRSGPSGRCGTEYHPTEHSTLIDLGPDQLAAQIDWP